MFIIALIVFCFVVPMFAYPSAFAYQRPPSDAEQRLMAEGKAKYEQKQREQRKKR